MPRTPTLSLAGRLGRRGGWCCLCLATLLLPAGLSPAAPAGENEVTIYQPAAATGRGETLPAPVPTPAATPIPKKKKKTATMSAKKGSAKSVSKSAAAKLPPEKQPRATTTATAEPEKKVDSPTRATAAVSRPVPAAGSVSISPVAPLPDPALARASVAATSGAGTVSVGAGPVIETGLPVARRGANAVTYPGSGGPRSPLTANGFVPGGALTSGGLPGGGLPSGGVTALGAGLFSNPGGRRRSAVDEVSSRKRTIYPWHRDIITTIFWIGEGASGYNDTTNLASSWDEEWTHNYRGVDTPNDRAAYGPASHAFTGNPFYVALPFNDLAFPNKSNRWVPDGWSKPNRDGKQVSACKDRWVEIKNRQGDICFAQWEDVGPFNVDHAEYVFGSERPNSPTGAGLDVSPAVAQYLSLSGKNRFTSWRFVDAEEVPIGQWLKYDEQAVVMQALLQLKSTKRPLPVQSAKVPIEDDSRLERSKRQVGAAKG